jgi:SAM-dependent methyltransferase
LVFEACVVRLGAVWLRRWREERFDHRHEVETSGFLTLQQLGLSAAQAAESHNYEGTPEVIFEAAFDVLSLDWKNFEFVDYGSGMGKALLLAARYPFRRVTGVEFSAELHGIAERNIAHWRLPGQRCHSVRSILADATTWPLPEGNCLLYFFNPFRQALLRKVLSNIILEATRKTRDVVYIVYINPSFPEVFDEFPELKSVACVRFVTHLYEIYKVEEPSAHPAQSEVGRP